MSERVETTDGAAPASAEDGGHAPEGAERPPVDRAAALARGAPGVPVNFLLGVLGLVLALALGGLVAEHVFSSVGLNPTPTTTSTTAARSPAATPGAPAPTQNRSLSAPLAAFMGLHAPTPRPAPTFTLTDQKGVTSSVPAQPPDVVVLTFFDAPCNDICPVLAAEITQADAELGPLASHVQFLTVNTDPNALAASAAAPALAASGLGALTNWHMLTGPLSSLNPVWKAYGVSISVDTKTGQEAHNNVMDFIDAQGTLRYRATPFGDENAKGTYSLSSAEVHRWAQGIAAYAARLVTQ